ncbi:MAG: MEDS domain-containing protein [Salinigranum sp.]
MNTVPERRSERHPEGDHYTLLYDSLEERLATVVPFMREGIEAGERCVYVGAELSDGRLSEALRSADVDVEGLVASDALDVHTPERTYLSGEEFDPDRMLAFLEREISGAVDDGYEGLRITGETAWLAEYDVDFGAFAEYERGVDDRFRDEPFVGLCQYDRSQFSAAQLDFVLRTHPYVSLDATRGANPYYSDRPDEAADAVTAETIDRKLETIADYTETRASLRDRNRSLSLLDDSARQLRDGDCGEIERYAVRMVTELVDSAFGSLWSVHGDAEGIEPLVTHSDVGPVDETRLVAEAGERAWSAFADDERRRFSFRPAATDGESRDPIRGYALPLGRHGTLLVGTDRSEGLADSDLSVVGAICGQTEAALERRAHERDIEEKNAELKRKNERLERLDRINALVRRIAQVLVNASTREEIERELCRRLAREPSIAFAWFGAYDEATGTLSPKQRAGDGQGYPEALSLDEAWTDREPTGRAAESGETRAVQTIHERPPLAHWRQQALRRGFRSAISLPVRYDGSMFGTISLYSSAADTFDGEFRAILEELGGLTAHAINGLERRRALVTGTVTELELRLGGDEPHVTEFVGRTGSTIEIDGVVDDGDGGFRVFSTVSDASREEIERWGVESPVIESGRILSSNEEGHRCESVITDRCLVATLLDHNAVPRSARVEGGEVHMVLQLPRERSVREFVDMLREKYPQTELVGRRDRERSYRGVSELKRELDEELSERQREILEIAYRSGYFEQPRERTAQGIADALDVTHPTVSRHLREAERRVFTLLLDER